MTPIPQTHVSTPQGFNVQAPLQSSQDTESVVSILPATVSLIGAVKPDGTTITVTADGTISGVAGPGGVTAVTGTAPIASSGGPTPAISVAAATAAALGVVRPDGTIITVSGGAITVPKASASVFGVVEVDGTTITAAAGIISAASGGVNSQTANYLATPGDNGKTIVMNGTSLTVTLPAVPPSATWNCHIVNLAATTLTINPNGLQLNGTISNLGLFAFQQGVYITTDGTNYFFVGGRASKATPSQFGIVEVDGTTITAASGVISAATATSGALGVVKPDGTIITVTAGAITVPKASASVFGVVEVDGTTITAAGGVISAAGSGAMTQIAQQVLAAPAASVTFGSIPSTFTNLLLVMTASSSAVAISDAIYMQFNGDTAANYGSATFFFNFGGTGNGGSAATATPNIGQCGATTTFGAPSSGFSIEIPGYAGTVFDKTASAKCMASVGNVSFVPNMTINGLVWKNTAAVVSILLGLVSAANFITGSVFTLYGLK